MSGPAAPAAAERPLSVLVTGAGGLVGRRLVRTLATDRRDLASIVALDVRPPAEVDRVPGVEYRTVDVCAPELAAVLAEHAVTAVVHLAAIVTPPPGLTREQQYAVDVGGTENVLAACLRAGVRKLVVTSSGAAYGYHADNDVPLTEDSPLRGNPEFAYSDHKRRVEELLARHRREHPELEQLVLRLGTVLGESASNQITALFEKPVLLGVRGSSAPFVFAWDEDVAACIAQGLRRGAGVYNLVGDGVMTMREIAACLGKPYVELPAPVLASALRVLRRRGLTRYGPEQVDFLRYRPVLSNERLKRELGFRPKVGTREAFERWRGRRARRSVVVTGAAGGIGRAVAARFAAAGDRVALLDVDAPALERTARELRAAGADVTSHPCDVRDEAACRAAMRDVVEARGGIDVLVNNAGIAHRSLLAETDPAVVRRVMEVNFFGAVHCTTAALPSVVARRGTIVALSSVAGFAPLVGRTGYAASKHALHGFFDSLRAELAGSGTAVLLVCPSFVDTGIDAHALSGSGAPAGAVKVTVGRPASAGEVADAVFDAVARRQELLVLSPVGKASYWVSRLAPGVYARIMRARVGKEFGLSR
jgi:UDP-glucose 4-epimerase